MEILPWMERHLTSEQKVALNLGWQDYHDQEVKPWIKELLCHHNWLRSRYVNIATGKNLGCVCTKCGKWKP